MSNQDDIFKALKEGDLWSIPVIIVALGAGSANKIGFTTGAYAVMLEVPSFDLVSANATYSAEFELFERTSYSGGIALASKNRNLNIRASMPASIMNDFKIGVVATESANDRVALSIISSDSKRLTVQGESPNLILEPNTSYVFTSTNNGTQSLDIQFRAFVWKQSNGS